MRAGSTIHPFVAKGTTMYDHIAAAVLITAAACLLIGGIIFGQQNDKYELLEDKLEATTRSLEGVKANLIVARKQLHYERTNHIITKRTIADLRNDRDNYRAKYNALLSKQQSQPEATESFKDHIDSALNMLGLGEN